MKKLLFLILLLPALAQAQWQNLGTGTWQQTADGKLVSTTFGSNGRKTWYQKAQVDSLVALYLKKMSVANQTVATTIPSTAGTINGVTFVFTGTAHDNNQQFNGVVFNSSVTLAGHTGVLVYDATFNHNAHIINNLQIDNAVVGNYWKMQNDTAAGTEVGMTWKDTVNVPKMKLYNRTGNLILPASLADTLDKTDTHSLYVYGNIYAKNISSGTPIGGVGYEPSTGKFVATGVALGVTSATLDFPSTAAGTSSVLTITVSGAVSGDVVSLGVGAAANNANSCFTAYVSATNTVAVKFNNYSSGAIDPASATFKVEILR